MSPRITSFVYSAFSDRFVNYVKLQNLKKIEIYDSNFHEDLRDGYDFSKLNNLEELILHYWFTGYKLKFPKNLKKL